MRRLKNIEGKNEQQLVAVKDQGEKQLDIIKDPGLPMMFKDEKNSVKNKPIFETIIEVSKNKNAKKEAKKIEETGEKIDYNDSNNWIAKSGGIDFSGYMDTGLFAKRIFNDSFSLEKAEKMQDKMKSKITKLKNYNPRTEENKD